MENYADFAHDLWGKWDKFFSCKEGCKWDLEAIEEKYFGKGCCSPCAEYWIHWNKAERSQWPSTTEDPLQVFLGAMLLCEVFIMWSFYCLCVCENILRNEFEMLNGGLPYFFIIIVKPRFKPFLHQHFLFITFSLWFNFHKQRKKLNATQIPYMKKTIMSSILFRDKIFFFI